MQHHISDTIETAVKRLLRGLKSGLLLAALFLASSQTVPAQFYVQSNLVSDLPGMALETDTNLVGAWGTAHSGSSPWWVNTTFSGLSLLFNGAGKPLPLVVSIPPTNGATATGLVYNGGDGFQVGPTLPARFIFATLNGTISGWNPNQPDPAVAVLTVSNSTAAYAGIALAQNNGQDFLYAANFAQNQIDVFDTNFSPVTLPPRAFTDSRVPADLSAFNVQLVGDWLYVTYAPTNALGPGTGAGRGWVDVFDVNGVLHRRLEHGFWMNSPWGVVQAPADFGILSNRILVGMFGSGAIASFGEHSGRFRGFMRNTDGLPIVISKGLWGLGFGNGGNAGETNVLYFASDFRFVGHFHGLFGTLTPAPAAPDEQEPDTGHDDHGDHGRD